MIKNFLKKLITKSFKRVKKNKENLLKRRSVEICFITKKLPKI